MFTDSELLKGLANNGILDEEFFDIMLKLAKTTIGFDLIPGEYLIDTIDKYTTSNNDE